MAYIDRILIDNDTYDIVDRQNIATVETNASDASKAYSVGQYLIYDGVLYRVTSAIAIHGNIVNGTNVTSVKAMDEVSNSDAGNVNTRLNTLETNTSGVATYIANAQFGNANGIRYEVRGNVIFITINTTRQSSAPATDNFVDIAYIAKQIDNNGSNNAYDNSSFRSGTPYELGFIPSSGRTTIRFYCKEAASATTGNNFVRGCFSFALA